VSKSNIGGVCHLIRAEAEIFQIRPEDRVFQGASIAFDASVEEIWLAFFAGATLVVGTSEMLHAGPSLAGMLTDGEGHGVILRSDFIADDGGGHSSLRLLILGGEACPPGLVKKWWNPRLGES